MNLTERRHRQTRIEIADAAVALFVQTGFGSTTMAHVAGAAGVSRRTVYRHFPNKEDLVFDHPTRWLEHFDTVISERTEVETTRDVCRRALVSIAELIQATATPVRETYAILVANPSLRGRRARTQYEWVARYVALISPDVGEREEARLEVQLMAGVLMSMTNTLVSVWASSGQDSNMVSLTHQALDRIDPLWPIEARSAPNSNLPAT